MFSLFNLVNISFFIIIKYEQHLEPLNSTLTLPYIQTYIYDDSYDDDDEVKDDGKDGVKDDVVKGEVRDDDDVFL